MQELEHKTFLDHLLRYHIKSSIHQKLKLVVEGKFKFISPNGFFFFHDCSAYSLNFIASAMSDTKSTMVKVNNCIHSNSPTIQ